MARSGPARVVVGRAHVELAPIPGGRRGGRLEVGEVADRAPLCGTGQKRGPGRRGRGVPSVSIGFPLPPDAPKGAWILAAGWWASPEEGPFASPRRGSCRCPAPNRRPAATQLQPQPESQSAGGIRRVRLLWTSRCRLWASGPALAAATAEGVTQELEVPGRASSSWVPEPPTLSTRRRPLEQEGVRPPES